MVGALAEISVPPGEMIEVRKGGQESFRMVMEKVKKMPLTGYLQSSLALEGHDSSGIIIFEAGRPIYAIYSFRPSGNESVEIIYRGERAMEFVCGDSLYSNAEIELHKVGEIKELEKVLKGRDVSKDYDRPLENILHHKVVDGKAQKAPVAQVDDADQMAAAILEFHLRNIKEKASPKKELRIDVELTEGESYLVEEASRDYSHGIFAYLVEDGMTGLGITRANPRGLRSRIGKGEAQIYWLTDHETKSEETISPSLEKIMVVVEEFLSKNDRCVVLIDDLQYLVSSNNFEGAVRFIRSLVDKMSEKKAMFLMSVDPASLNNQERSIIEREMNVIRSA